MEALDSILYKRIVALPHAHHVVGGDWQAEPEVCRFGIQLRDLGWLSHGDLCDALPTNVPPVGTSRRLDELWVSPNMRAFVTSGCQFPVPEASTHDMLALDVELEIPGRMITMASRPLSTNEVHKKLADADMDAWTTNGEGDALNFYKWWRTQLCRWLKMPVDSVGVPRSHVRRGCQNLHAPVTPRTLFRQNLARKVSLWLTELGNLMNRGVWMVSQQAAVEKLCTKLGRMPWQSWCACAGTPLPTPSGDLWSCARDWSMWGYHYWSCVHTAVLEQARHGLKAWRNAMKEAVTTGHLRPIGKWLKGNNELPILKTDNGFLTDPDMVGKEVRDAWAQVYCPENLEVMAEEQVQRIASSMRQVPWTCPQLTFEILKDELMRKKDSAAGPDNITLMMLKHLPPRGLSALAEALQIIEREGIWPPELTMIAAVAIPRPDKQPSVGPLKFRVISITSQVYRLWASAKAHFIHRHWIPRVVPAAVHGGVPHKSARTATHLEALTWETASSKAQPLWALYADASRCFDCLRYSDLLLLAGALGLDESLVRSLGSWYRDQKRTVQIEGVQQTSVRLPQGCPLSVALCALWGAVWATGAEALLTDTDEEDITKRATVYLDDISVLVSNKQIFLRMAGFTSLFFREWGITMNVDKSAMVANARAQSDGALQLAFRQDEDATLLGTMTGPFPKNHMIRERCERALRHLKRLRHLPLAQSLITKIIQIYVVPLLYCSEMVSIPEELKMGKGQMLYQLACSKSAMHGRA